MKKWILILVCLFFGGAGFVSAAEPEIQFTKTYTSPRAVIDRARTYDQAPTIIEEDGIYKVWYCGGSLMGDPYGGHDSIYYTELDQNGNTLSAPTRVLTAALNDSSESGDHTCAVTVVKDGFGAIQNGKEMYKMYYECAPRVYQTNTNRLLGCYTQICHAVSDDGKTWRVFNNSLPDYGYGNATTNPSAVIGLSMTYPQSSIVSGGSIKQDIGLAIDATGKHWVTTPSFVNSAGSDMNFCGEPAKNYGTGHPSAVVINGQIWLWYYDSQGDWNKRSLFLAKSDDGFHFFGNVRTNLQSGLKIKYINTPINGKPGFFLGNGSPFSINVFNYSWDGLTWAWQDQGYASFYTDYLKNNYLLGQATACVVGGQGVAGNKYGQINSLGISFLSTEGHFGPSDSCTATNGCTCYSQEEDYSYIYPHEDGFLDGYHGSRGNTWGMYLIKGQFSSIIPTPTPLPKPGDITGDGKVDSADFNKIVAEFGRPYTIFDYNIVIGNFGK